MSKPLYEYKLVNISMERGLPPYPEIDDIANKYAAEGWRMVAFIPATDQGYSECLMLERSVYQPVGMHVVVTEEMAKQLEKFNEWAAIDRSGEKTWDERDLLPKSDCGG